MRIGILSDSHDHVWNLRAAVDALQSEADVLLHCGDLCSPFIVPLLARFPGPVHAIFGNNDADRYRLQRLAAKTPNVRLHGETFLTELGGLRVAVHHFDNLARPLAESGRFDLVCFGHNHVHEVDRVGDTWIVNPGTILGYLPTKRRDTVPTFVVHDTETKRPRTWHLSEGRAVAGEPDTS